MEGKVEKITLKDSKQQVSNNSKNQSKNTTQKSESAVKITSKEV